MKKNVLIPVIAGLFLFFCVFTAWSDIILDKLVKEKVEKIAADTKSIIYVDKRGVEQTQAVLKKWVSQVIDLSNIKPRESKVFNRTSYLQENRGEEILILLDGSRQIVKSSEPVELLYREGPLYFKWVKTKDFVAKTRLDERAFAELGIKFILNNQFIIESKNDRVGNYEVMSSVFANETGKDGSESVEYPGQQDVVFYRSFRGKPVFNSIALVGINPDNKEIVELNLCGWTVVDETLEIRLTAAELAKTGAATSSQLMDRVYRVVKENVDLQQRNVIVKDLVDGYFQTNESLVSVMGIQFDVVYKGDDGTEQVEEFFEAVNLTGSDDIFFADYREKQESEAPPK